MPIANIFATFKHFAAGGKLGKFPDRRICEYLFAGSRGIDLRPAIGRPAQSGCGTTVRLSIPRSVQCE